MKKDKLIDAMNDIDDKYIEEAKQRKRFVFDWAFVGKLLTGFACILLVVILIPNLIGVGASFKTLSQDNSYEFADATTEAAMPSEAPAAAPMLEEAGEDTVAIDGYNLADTKTTNVLLQNKKLIVNGNMVVETTNFDETILALSKNVEEVGGYFQNSSISTDAYSGRNYDASIRIPADKYQDFVSQAKQNGNVTWYNESVDDITDTYTNLEARLKSLKAEEEKVLEFYDQASNLEELMSVEARLTNIRYEIDSIENNIKNYDLQINYSTLYISIHETKVYTNTKTTFLQRIGMAFSNGFANFVETIEDLFVGIVYNIWLILLIVVIAIVLIILIKKFKNKNK